MPPSREPRPRPSEGRAPRVRPLASERPRDQSRGSAGARDEGARGAAGGNGEERGERLQRTLARAGYGSRRSVEDLIRDERVQINGRVAELGNRVDPGADRVTVDGVPVPTHPELRYLALNKPAGVTTTLRDRHASRTVADLVPPGPRVIPVGRLDRETEGLLLLTNDGTLAYRLQHPRFGVEKEYLAEVRGAISRSAVHRLTEGVALEDGPARAMAVGPVRRLRDRSSLGLVMGEGRKREVRRMLEAVGHPVTRLVRVRVGPVHLGPLRPGEWRALSADEVAGLYRAAGLDIAAPGDRRTHGRRRPSTST